MSTKKITHKALSIVENKKVRKHKGVKMKKGKVKQWMTILMVIFSVGFAQTGWNYINYGTLGDHFNPNASTQLVDDFGVAWTGNSSSGSYYVLTGNVIGDDRLEIINANGSVIQIWSADGTLLEAIETDNSDLSGPTMLFDVNSDGFLDIGFGTWGNSSLIAGFYSGDGTLLKTFTRTAGNDAMMSPIGIASDGNVLMGLQTSYSWSTVRNRGIAKFDMDTGEEMWFYEIGPSQQAYLRGCSIADINGDGTMEISIPNGTVSNGCSGSGYNGNGTTTYDSGHLYYITINENANEVFTYDEGSSGTGFCLFADLYGDGNYSIYGAEGHGTTYYHGDASISKLNPIDGVPSAVHEFGYDGHFRLSFADLDGDGVKEIIANEYRLRESTYIFDPDLNILWEGETPGRMLFVNDIDGDGEIELGFMDDTIFRVYTASTFQEEWFYDAGETIS